VFCNLWLRHPGIPTEWSLSVFDWGLWRYSFREGDTHLKIAQLHQQHGIKFLHISLILPGNVVRIQPNHLSFSSLKAIEDIHSVKAKAKKGAFYKDVIRGPPKSPVNILNVT
jgi:hypothetical protein